MKLSEINAKQLLTADVFDLVQERPAVIRDFAIMQDYLTRKGRNLLLRSGEHGITIAVELMVTEDGFRMRIRPGSISEENPRWRLMRLQFLPNLMDTAVNSEGHYLLPLWAGALVDFRERPHIKNADRVYLDQSEWEKFSGMNCCAQLIPEGGCFAIVEEGDFHCYVQSEFNDNGVNHLYMDLIYRKKKEDHLPMENYTVAYHFLEPGANYGDCAVIYRKYFEDMGIGLLRERAVNNPVLAYSIDAMRVKIFMAHKEPTPDGSAPVIVHADCKDCMTIMDAMKNAGIEKAVITLVGWNYGGHDGAYPRHFPIEPAIGGEEGLRELIAYAKKIGYQIVPHDNATDIYRSNEEFSELVSRYADGTPVGGGMWSGGLAYKSCPLAMIRRSGREFERIKDLGFEGHYYLDAQPSALFRCDAPNHPADEKEFAMILAAISQIPRSLYGAISMEGVWPYTVRFTDETGSIHCPEENSDYYDRLPEHTRQLEPYPVPMYAIALHGLILLQRVWVHHYEDAKRGLLRELAFGFRPCMEVSLRNNGGNGGDYLDCIEKLKDMAALCFKDLKLQTVPFRSFAEPVRGFYDAVYENGVRIKVNISDKEYDGVASGSYQIIRSK